MAHRSTEDTALGIQSSLQWNDFMIGYTRDHAQSGGVYVRFLQLLALPMISIGAFSMIGCDARSGGVDIWNAVAADSIDDVRVFAQSGGNLNQKNASGETVLMHALEKGSLASYGELLALDSPIPRRR